MVRRDSPAASGELLAGDAALEALADQAAHLNADLTENRDIATTLRMSGPMSVIGDDLAGHAESVVLDAISYAVRHSGATQLTVAVTVADELDVTITDDGCGISADNQRHSGLANMASRAEQIGGDCHLTTPLGGGTEVNWTAPFAHVPASSTTIERNNRTHSS